MFEINDVTGDLKLKGQLNYNTLSTFYRLKVQAKVSMMREDIKFCISNN